MGFDIPSGVRKILQKLNGSGHKEAMIAAGVAQTRKWAGCWQGCWSRCSTGIFPTAETLRWD